MNLSKHILAIISGIGLLSSGCVGVADSTEAEGIDVPSVDTLDYPGGGHTNGLTAAGFHLVKGLLQTATSYALFSNAPTINPAVTNTGLLGSDHGKATFVYAVQCAVSKGTIEWDNIVHPAEGIMSSTSGWETGALGEAPTESLFACMIALLNKEGKSVDLYLTGPEIGIKSAQGNFTYREALWQADFNPSTGSVTFAAWPLDAITNKCGTNTSSYINDRVCGTPEGGCGLTIHNSLAGCSQVDVDQDTVIDPEEEGIWNCNGRPAIQTWLKADGIDSLYARCEPPPQ